MLTAEQIASTMPQPRIEPPEPRPQVRRELTDAERDYFLNDFMIENQAEIAEAMDGDLDALLELRDDLAAAMEDARPFLSDAEAEAEVDQYDGRDPNDQTGWKA